MLMKSVENAVKQAIYMKIGKKMRLIIALFGKQSAFRFAHNQIIGQITRSTPRIAHVLMKIPRVSKENPLFSSPKHG